MKRRKFILITVAAFAVASVPVFRYRCRNSGYADPLLRPAVLACICGEEEIVDIGNHYRSLVPAENKKDRLINLILSDSRGKQIKPPDDSTLDSWIEQRVRDDFKEQRTVIVDGWILSETEVRQCALISIAEN